MRTKFISLAMVFVLLSPNVRSQWVQTDGPGHPYPGVYSLVVSGTTIFAGTSDGGGVFLSTNNGTSWTAVNIGLTVAPVWSLAVSGTNLFAGTGGGGIFASSNYGASWTASNTGLPTQSLVVALVVSGSNVFAGTYDDGVFLSTNNGVRWTAVNLGLPATPIYSFAIIGTYLLTGTGKGVWRRPLSEMITSVDGGVNELPHKFLLRQNYPNPFNPSTTIKYELPKSSQVTLSVYDVLGREVSVLVNEGKNAGVREVMFDASNLASGVYLYRLQAGDFVQTRKLMIL